MSNGILKWSEDRNYIILMRKEFDESELLLIKK